LTIFLHEIVKRKNRILPIKTKVIGSGLFFGLFLVWRGLFNLETAGLEDLVGGVALIEEMLDQSAGDGRK